jgi:transcriptional regulator with XRE-family HTH domain
MHNYGLIIRKLRKLNGYSLKNAALKISKSVGWLSEIENSRGLARLTQYEFARIVLIFGGEKYKK